MVLYPESAAEEWVSMHNPTPSMSNQTRIQNAFKAQ